MMRWFAVRETRVVESDDPMNYRYVDGRLESAVVTFEPLREGHRVEWNPFKHDEYGLTTSPRLAACLAGFLRLGSSYIPSTSADDPGADIC